MKRSLGLLIFCFVPLVFPPLATGQAPSTRLNLDQLVEEAIQNNPEILAAKKREEVYREKVPQASASFSAISLIKGLFPGKGNF